jgi:hypothetical protein
MTWPRALVSDLGSDGRPGGVENWCFITER